MTGNVEARKIELISFIANLHQEESISNIEKVVKKLKSSKYKNQEFKTTRVSDADVAYFKRPWRKSITPDELAREQNWQPIDEKEMDAIVKRMDIQEPIEQLLADLKALD